MFIFNLGEKHSCFILYKQSVQYWLSLCYLSIVTQKGCRNILCWIWLKILSEITLMSSRRKKIKAKYTHSHISTTKEKAPRRSFLDGCIGGQTSFRRRSEHAKRRGRVISKQASMTFFFFLRFFSSALTLNYLSKIYSFLQIFHHMYLWQE